MSSKGFPMRNEEHRFQDYIQFLRENFANLITYREATGAPEPAWSVVKKNLFDADPFVVFGASVLATAAFADKNLYH